MLRRLELGVQSREIARKGKRYHRMKVLVRILRGELVGCLHLVVEARIRSGGLWEFRVFS